MGVASCRTTFVASGVDHSCAAHSVRDVALKVVPDQKGYLKSEIRNNIRNQSYLDGAVATPTSTSVLRAYRATELSPLAVGSLVRPLIRTHQLRLALRLRSAQRFRGDNPRRKA